MKMKTAFIAAVCLAISPLTRAQTPNEPVLALARTQAQPLLETLKQICSIESGSRELEGLNTMVNLIADRLQASGGNVEILSANTDVYKMEDTPDEIGKMVKATWRGTGTKKIAMIAHMDTVYPKGMLARQPFRIDGNKAYGLGITDDKQGVAMIIHIVEMLRAIKFDQFAQLTVLINGDEEISSPGSRAALIQLGIEHDVVMSFEASREKSDKLSLATAGIASVNLNVTGRASHSGGSPENGINALYELSHQILQTRDLSDPKLGIKMNWTMSKAGITRNMIPPYASASADVRVLRVEDYDEIERKIRERIKTQLLPNAKVELTFERRRPPLEANEAGKKLAALSQAVYSEIGMKLVVDAVAEGGGTDAAFAALKTKGGVVERYGLRGFGAHTTDAEYVLIDSIVPRLYLAVRTIVEASK